MVNVVQCAQTQYCMRQNYQVYETSPYGYSCGSFLLSNSHKDTEHSQLYDAHACPNINPLKAQLKCHIYIYIYIYDISSLRVNLFKA